MMDANARKAWFTDSEICEYLRYIGIKNHYIGALRKPIDILAPYPASEVVLIPHIIILFIIRFLIHISSFQKQSLAAH
jgi:hypothetical protein